jgi:hypothetical protein
MGLIEYTSYIAESNFFYLFVRYLSCCPYKKSKETASLTQFWHLDVYQSTRNEKVSFVQAFQLDSCQELLAIKDVVIGLDPCSSIFHHLDF